MFDREVMFEVRVDGGSEEDIAVEPLKIRVLSLGEDKQTYNVRIEAQSEQDIFFSFITKQIYESQQFQSINEEKYKIIQDEHHIAVFTLDNESGKGFIEFYQDTEFRRVDIMKIEMIQLDEESVKTQVTFRINSMKQKTSMMYERIKDVVDIVQDKNPMLVSEIYKGSHATLSTANFKGNQNLNQTSSLM